MQKMLIDISGQEFPEIMVGNLLARSFEPSQRCMNGIAISQKYRAIRGPCSGRVPGIQI